MVYTYRDFISFVEKGTFSRTKGQCVQVVRRVVGDGWEEVPLRNVNLQAAEKKFTSSARREGLAETTVKSYFSTFRRRLEEYENAMRYMTNQPQGSDQRRSARRVDDLQGVEPSTETAEVFNIPLRLDAGMGTLTIPMTLSEEDVERIHDIALHYVG